MKKYLTLILFLLTQNALAYTPTGDPEARQMSSTAWSLVEKINRWSSLVHMLGDARDFAQRTSDFKALIRNHADSATIQRSFDDMTLAFQHLDRSMRISANLRHYSYVRADVEKLRKYYHYLKYVMSENFRYGHVRPETPNEMYRAYPEAPNLRYGLQMR